MKLKLVHLPTKPVGRAPMGLRYFFHLGAIRVRALQEISFNKIILLQ